MDYADRQVDKEYGGGLNFRITNDGVGIVLSF